MTHLQKNISIFLLVITLFLNIVRHNEPIAAKNLAIVKISQIPPDLGDELYQQGREYYRVGNFQKALDFWLQALTAYRQSKKLTYISRTLSNILRG